MSELTGLSKYQVSRWFCNARTRRQHSKTKGSGDNSNDRSPNPEYSDNNLNHNNVLDGFHHNMSAPSYELNNPNTNIFGNSNTPTNYNSALNNLYFSVTNPSPLNMYMGMNMNMNMNMNMPSYPSMSSFGISNTAPSLSTLPLPPILPSSYPINNNHDLNHDENNNNNNILNSVNYSGYTYDNISVPPPLPDH